MKYKPHSYQEYAIRYIETHPKMCIRDSRMIHQ